MSNNVLDESEKRIDLERLQIELSRSDHVLFLLVEAIGAVHAAVRRWRNRRRTRRALANLNGQQLRDIGLERDDFVSFPPTWSPPCVRSYRALASLGESEVGNLSPMGRRLRKQAQQAHSLG